MGDANGDMPYFSTAQPQHSTALLACGDCSDSPEQLDEGRVSNERKRSLADIDDFASAASCLQRPLAPNKKRRVTFCHTTKLPPKLPPRTTAIHASSSDPMPAPPPPSSAGGVVLPAVHPRTSRGLHEG